jgi:hypothetical protein
MMRVDTSLLPSYHFRIYLFLNVHRFIGSGAGGGEGFSAGLQQLPWIDRQDCFSPIVRQPFFYVHLEQGLHFSCPVIMFL